MLLLLLPSSLRFIMNKLGCFCFTSVVAYMFFSLKHTYTLPYLALNEKLCVSQMNQITIHGNILIIVYHTANEFALILFSKSRNVYQCLLKTWTMDLAALLIGDHSNQCLIWSQTRVSNLEILFFLRNQQFNSTHKITCKFFCQRL